MRKFGILLLFLSVSVGGGLAIGLMTAPGDWYAALNKPFFNPPNWIFGPVWTILYLAIAIAGWRVWSKTGTGWLLRIWFVQMGLNLMWSPAFFALQQPSIALVIILLLLATVVFFILLARKKHRLAAILFIPYAVWVAFASALNGAIVLLNPTV